ncbi:MAG: ornithine carbamoyltransferase [Gaiellaceae bacterium]|jgi:ornithine carbamoyltransferase
MPGLPTNALKGRHFLRVADWTSDELRAVLGLADELKMLLARGRPHKLLPGRSLALIFNKASTRTRVSFEVGICQLGGTGVSITAEHTHLARGETLKDTACVLSRYVDAIVIRTGAQSEVVEMAAHATVPVINALTDSSHPCQALADVMTIHERFGRFEGVRLAYFGDGNNVCASLMVAAAKLGMSFVGAFPEGYEPTDQAQADAREAAAESGGSVEIVRDPEQAAAGADVLYTDVWVSMGEEDEREARLAALRGYAIDEHILETAAPEAIVMHCLPAHYGEEISEQIVHGHRSAVWDQAENRLHAQKALMALVLR